MTDILSRTCTGSAFDTRAFRSALGAFPTGVAIITTLGPDGAPAGLTCNSFSSVSLEPPLVSWSLRKASKSLEIFRAAPYFTVNLLTEDQDVLSGRFASGKPEGKFDGVQWRPGAGGTPVLESCLVNFECKTFAMHDAGDHLIFIGEVIRFSEPCQHEPLVFYKGAYMMVAQSLREVIQRGDASPMDLQEARTHIMRVVLSLACEAGTREDFDRLEAHIEAIEAITTTDDIEKRMQSGVAFYSLIAEAAHNPVLCIVANSLHTLLHHAYREKIRQARTLVPGADLINRSIMPLRRELVARLRARDAEGAAFVLDRCLKQSSLLKSVEELVTQ